MIEFNNPETFPKVLLQRNSELEKYVDLVKDNPSEWWQLRAILQDNNISNIRMVSSYIDEHLDDEISLFHYSRLQSFEQIMKEGLITGGNRNGLGDKRIRSMLSSVGFSTDHIEMIMNRVYYYWERDVDSRNESVHFVIDRNHIIRDDTFWAFTENIGGEILSWAIEDCGFGLDNEIKSSNMLRELGVPCVVNFKCKLSNIGLICRKGLIANIIMYNIIHSILNKPYCFDLT